MNIKYVVAASLLLSISAFAQKDELKALKKIDDKDVPTAKDITDFKGLLDKAEPLIASATPDQQADFYYYKAEYAGMQMLQNPQLAPTLMADAISNYNKVIELEKSGKQNHTKEIQVETFPALKGIIANAGRQLAQANKLDEASKAFALAYQLDKKDGSMLYNAAAMAVNNKDYDTALKYYEELDQSGYTGEGTLYSAKNKINGQVEAFPSKATMDIAVKQGLYTDPKEEKIPSVKGEIVKNIALIYVSKGEKEKARTAIASARKANPDDATLILEDANISYQLGDMAAYSKAISEAIAKDPTNPTLYYNLGVVSTKTDVAAAKGYYKKAIELKPDYFDALTNLGLLEVADEKKINDEMNKLGTTAKDNQRFDVLKKQKETLYANALPYFEKAHNVKPDDQFVISTLAAIYQALERTADAKAMRAKIKK